MVLKNTENVEAFMGLRTHKKLNGNGLSLFCGLSDISERTIWGKGGKANARHFKSS